jgi:hypothetical protein
MEENVLPLSVLEILDRPTLHLFLAAIDSCWTSAVQDAELNSLRDARSAVPGVRAGFHISTRAFGETFPQSVLFKSSRGDLTRLQGCPPQPHDG